MKKLAIFVAAFVLTLGLAQCKKEQPVTPQTLEGETVHITVKVGSNGSKADINTTNGKITFNDGDKLYVGYNGSKVGGELIYSTSASSFSGDITIVQDGNDKPLHFYYLGGNLTPTIDGNQYTVDISDQASNYPVISYGISNEPYTGPKSYSTTLLNKCALVKFTFRSNITDAVVVGGMQTKATIDFSDPGVVTPSTPGEITLHPGSSDTEKWAILLPQDAVAEAIVAIGDGYRGYTVNVPKIEENGFVTSINQINNSNPGNVIFLNKLSDTEYSASNGQILTGEFASGKISIRDQATVTLAGVTINTINSTGIGIECLGNNTIILKDGTTNRVKGGSNYPGIKPTGTLTIQGTGTLYATGGGKGAGIGSGVRANNCGSINISGGIVIATGGSSAAGIGSGGSATSCGNINISGGTVTATGGSNAVGIGAGYGTSTNNSTLSQCGTITITNTVTKVTATKGAGAQTCIGASASGRSICGTVKFGDVTMYNGSLWVTTPENGNTYGGLNFTITMTNNADDTWELQP